MTHKEVDDRYAQSDGTLTADDSHTRSLNQGGYLGTYIAVAVFTLLGVVAI